MKRQSRGVLCLSGDGSGGGEALGAGRHPRAVGDCSQEHHLWIPEDAELIGWSKGTGGGTQGAPRQRGVILGKGSAGDNPQCLCRASEEAFLKESKEDTPGSEWEKVAQLCDFNPKSSKQSKDVSRMRSVLISLKQTPLSR